MEDKGGFYLGFVLIIAGMGTLVYCTLGWPGVAIMYGTMGLTALLQIRDLLYKVGKAIIKRMPNKHNQ